MRSSIDSLIANFDPKVDRSPKSSGNSYITIRIPVEHKQKYDMLQQQTNNEFSKLLKSVITSAIDSVPLDV